MAGADILMTNLLSPIVLAFVLGIVAGLLRSELELPDAVLKLISIYLLFSIGITGGQELARVRFSEISALLVVTAALVVLIPVVSFLVLRRIAGFDAANAAAVAAHYGSVSTATSSFSCVALNHVLFLSQSWVFGMRLRCCSIPFCLVLGHRAESVGTFGSSDGYTA
jgi:hypothetical protein